MAKKDPKATLDEFVNQLAAKQSLVEYARKEVPVPGQTAGGAIMVEYVNADPKNPFELAMVATPNDETMAKVKFPLTRELTDEQVESVAHDVLKLAGGIEGNLSIGAGNRIILSYSMTRKESDDVVDAGKTLNDTIARGASYGQGLRGILDKSFGLPTDPGAEKWYQYKLGQPVKLTAAEMNQLQGGDIIDGSATVLAAGLGSYFGVIGGVVVGVIAYAEEVAINHPEQIAPAVMGPSNPRPSGPTGPSIKTYCFTGDTRVLTSRGSIAMADLVAGDQISYRDVDGAERTTDVLGLDRHHGQFEMVEIVTSSGSLVATADHPFFHDGQWVRASELETSGAILAVRPAPMATEVLNVRTTSGVYTVGDAQLLVSGRVAAAAHAAA